MPKVSARVRRFRARAKPSAIMSSATFNRIARTSKGGKKAAGAAYWRAAKRRAAGKPKRKR
jgi:hypothetical protein